MSEKVETPYVYHYTDARGFEGIVTSQEIWATSIFYLNDWAEFVRAKRVIEQSLEPPHRTAAGVLLVNDTRMFLLDTLQTFGLDMRPHPYVCSFSGAEEGDDLSQWRAYCPNGGYAIGFPVTQLLTHAGMSDLALHRCDYHPAAPEKASGSFAKVAEELMQLPGAGTKVVSVLVRQLAIFIARFKNEAFQAEEESRLISYGEHQPAPRFRVSGNLVIPYIAFDVNSKDLWGQARVVLSPCSGDGRELRLESTKMFLQSELKRHNLPTTCAANVHPSQIPYRSAIGG